MKEKRYCKGCYADVTKEMYCHCGDFGLTKDMTYSEQELIDNDKSHLVIPKEEK